jgi:hypothetical protein
MQGSKFRDIVRMLVGRGLLGSLGLAAGITTTFPAAAKLGVTDATSAPAVSERLGAVREAVSASIGTDIGRGMLIKGELADEQKVAQWFSQWYNPWYNPWLHGTNRGLANGGITNLFRLINI